MNTESAKQKDNIINKSISEQDYDDQAIAVVGMGCRFPGGVNSPGEFWENLCNGFNAITEVPKDRWNAQAFYSEDREQASKLYTRFGGFVNVWRKKNTRTNEGIRTRN